MVNHLKINISGTLCHSTLEQNDDLTGSGQRLTQAIFFCKSLYTKQTLNFDTKKTGKTPQMFQHLVQSGKSVTLSGPAI